MLVSEERPGSWPANLREMSCLRVSRSVHWLPGMSKRGCARFPSWRMLIRSETLVGGDGEEPTFPETALGRGGKLGGGNGCGWGTGAWLWGD